MTLVRRTVERVTVFDGVDIPATGADAGNLFLKLVSARLIVVSVGANSVTYDIEFIFIEGNISGNLDYFISSSLISEGSNIIEQVIGDLVVDVTVNPNDFASDTHIRDSTNGRVVLNTLVANLELPP